MKFYLYLSFCLLYIFSSSRQLFANSFSNSTSIMLAELGVNQHDWEEAPTNLIQLDLPKKYWTVFLERFKP